MALNNQYMIAPSLQEVFRDKDSGLPLSAGIVTFYEDNNRTVKKPVYQLTGAPPNYTYSVLPNPCILGSAGTFVDGSGNDIIPYYYPYDANGNLQNYYITVYSSGNVFQFSREGWPNVTSETQVAENFINFVPNPQLLIHNNIPSTSTTVAGEITNPITQIAQGGWTFERPNASTATDIVSFFRYDSPIDNPTGDPRYAFHLETTVSSPGDTFKDLRLKFRDVNKFASADQQYTFSFTGQSQTGTTLNVTVYLIKNYGTGGSTETEESLATIGIGTTSDIYNTAFIFGTNAGKTIGTLDDDYIQLAIRFPTSINIDVLLTDFILTINDVNIISFPATTDAQMLYASTAGWLPVPDPDGFDLYLPIIFTKSGFDFDSSVIGTLTTRISSTPNVGELLCDGTQYETSAYSTDGIPYERLQSELYNSTYRAPLFGTGADYFISYTCTGISPSNQIRIVTNTQSSAVTNAADGTIPTGFTINTRASAGVRNIKAWITSTDSIIVEQETIGAVTNPAAAGTSGFTITEGAASYNDANARYEFTITGIVLPSAGTYFLFSNTTTDFYLWFTIDGSGSDPAIGGRTGIRLDLLSIYNTQEVTSQIREVLNGFQITTVVGVAGSSMVGGSYFTINSNAEAYYAWYTVDGVGVDPSPPNKIGIKVDILTADTAAQVVEKTLVAINQKYFAVPDFRGLYLRMTDATQIWDLKNNRFSVLSNFIPANETTINGTFEVDNYQSHNHTQNAHNHVTATGNQFVATSNTNPQYLAVGASTDFQYIANSAATANTTATNNPSGSYETRTVNASVNYFIKY